MPQKNSEIFKKDIERLKNLNIFIAFQQKEINEAQSSQEKKIAQQLLDKIITQNVTNNKWFMEKYLQQEITNEY